jgi:sugar lactone lactonase YvrE
MQTSATNYKISVLANEHCECGENPLWNLFDECVYWTDITNKTMFCYNPKTKSHKKIYEDTHVGGFTLQADGNLLLFRVKDMATLSPQGDLKILKTFDDPTMIRFNDVIADPEGRVYAGTIGKQTSGGIYRLDHDGTITKLLAQTHISNGMGFSPDLKNFYWTCSTRKQIFKFKYNRSSGDISDQTLFYEATTPEEGEPDGMVVDNDGTVWSAHYNGSGIFKHAADGSIIDKITFPIPKITSLCFGGPNFDTFYVTSAGGDKNKDNEEGSLYSVEANVKGPKEFLSKILI